MFGNLQNEIDKLISERKVVTPNTNYTGTIISKPGTEKVVLATTIADFMTCMAVGLVKDKARYCIVHKDQSVKYSGQYCDSNGTPISIISKAAFDACISIISSMSKQLQEYKRELDTTQIEKESLRMTIDALRKNGVID